MISSTVPQSKDHVCLGDVVCLLKELKDGLEEVRATLKARRKPHYTVEEVAEMTGRSPYTVRRWITEHKIKAIRITGTGPKGRLLIAREEIETLIAGGSGANVPESVLD